MARNLHNQVIVITGASAGIGHATAIACAQAGMRVVLAARRLDRLERIARQLTDAGHQALAVACDVARDQDVQQLVQRVMQHYGQLDVMFANAGYGLFGSVLETDDPAMRQLWEVNYFGTIRCIRAALPIMLQQNRGHLVICASAASEIGLPMYGHYSATKAAQDSIASALRAELCDTPIQVTSVHPIGTRTEFWDTAGKLADRPEAGLNTPKALMHSPQRVAEAIVRSLRRPRPEVWPSLATRMGLAMTTAVPRLGAWAMCRLMRRREAGG